MTDALTETDEASAADHGDEPALPDPPPPGGDEPPTSSLNRLWATIGGWWTRFMQMPVSGWVSLAVVGGCVLFVLGQLGPLKLLSDTTPTGGDMSAHVWGPAYLRDHLLTKGRLTGWSPDWYAGFPAFHFYMVPPFLVIALLSLVIPYGVAFKLVAVSGCVSLPIAVWAFGRLNKLPFPAPAFMAIGATFFLFDRSYAIYGGNLASTLAGEFAFAISLSLGILYLGVFGYGLRTGKARGWAALVLALCALCHVIPALFVAAASFAWLLVRPSTRTLLYAATVAPAAALLSAWWYLPFVGRSAYLNDMGWTKLTDWNLLFSRELQDSSNRNYPDLRFMVGAAAIGLVVSVLMRQRTGLFLGIVAAGSALAFRFLPETRLWNARVLPFYYLTVYMLAFAGAALVLVGVTRWFAAEDRPLEVVMQGVVVAGVVLASYIYLALPMQSLPFGSLSADGTTYEAGIGRFKLQTNDISYLRSWADWNFNGLEAWDERPAKDASGQETGEEVPTYDRSYPEFHDLIRTLERVSAEHGCGRAMWEYEENHDRYGSTMEPMMLPFFTDGCIGSMEGLYFEASATTPYHFINSTQLSKAGSAPQKELPYATMPPNQADFDQGIGHLQMLGVKYYMAIDDLMKERAAANPDLRRVADSGPWAIYLVGDSELVAPMRSEPVVLTGPKGVHDWLDTSACWYVNEALWSTPLVADGPEGWQRVGRTVRPSANESAQQKCSSDDGSDWGWLTSAPPEARSLPEVKVSNIEAGDDSISFDVDKTGVPVMVRTSYFPNWSVTGADGPFRATPNLMVVIPTSNHVELSYGTTSMEYFAYSLTLIGLVGLAWLFASADLRPAMPGRFWAPGERDEPLPGDDLPSPPPGRWDPATSPPGAGGEAGAGAPVDLAKYPPGDAPPAPDGDAPPVGAVAAPDGPDVTEPAPVADDRPPGDAPGGFAPPE